MLSQIISNTPKWVFALFFVLLALGVSQMRTQSKSKKRVLIIPIVMFFLSFLGVISAFGKTAMPIAAWAVGYIALVSLIRRGLPISDNSTNNSYNPETKRFTAAGSAVPLGLMMSIFFLKYFVGASMGMNASFTHNASFPIVVSLLYGAFSGVFAGRALRLMRLAK
jgi:hypothetical protein